jgi:hypothetical protein
VQKSCENPLEKSLSIVVSFVVTKTNLAFGHQCLPGPHLANSLLLSASSILFIGMILLVMDQLVPPGLHQCHDEKHHGALVISTWQS